MSLWVITDFIVLGVIAAIIVLSVLVAGIRDMEFREPDLLFFELSISLMVGGFLFATIAWNLVEFNTRVKQGSKED
jgi:hypothetical protein